MTNKLTSEDLKKIYWNSYVVCRNKYDLKCWSMTYLIFLKNKRRIVVNRWGINDKYELIICSGKYIGKKINLDDYDKGISEIDGIYQKY